MPTIRTRAAKGSDLTPTEADSNFKKTVRQVTTTAATLISDNRGVVEGNHASTPFTITLLAVATAAAAEPGDYSVTITNIGAALVSVDGNASETINGSTSALSLGQYDSVTLAVNSAGTGWQTVSPSTYDILKTPTAGSNPSLAFDTWRTPNTDRPTLVIIDATAATDSATDGLVYVDIDEGGGTTIDYQFTLAWADAAMASGAEAKGTTTFLMFPGGSYRIVNSQDPVAGNGLSNHREYTL